MKRSKQPPRPGHCVRCQRRIHPGFVDTKQRCEDCYAIEVASIHHAFVKLLGKPKTHYKNRRALL